VSRQSPWRAYDRQWALSVLDAVLDRMQREPAEAGKAAVFEALKELFAALAG